MATLIDASALRPRFMRRLDRAQRGWTAGSFVRPSSIFWSTLGRSRGAHYQEKGTLQGKVVIITGASSGIGAASAKLLAAKGAKPVLGARREDKLKTLAEEIRTTGGEATYLVLDVTQQADNDAIVKLAKDTYGTHSVGADQGTLPLWASISAPGLHPFFRMAVLPHTITLRGVGF